MKDKNNLAGIALLLLGVLLSVGTAWLFPTCDPKEDGTWMKCHWSGQVTIGIGTVIAVIALIYLLISDGKLRAGLSLAIVPVGVLDIAVLNGVIGLCGKAEMQCRAITKPTVTIINAAVIILAVVNTAWLLRKTQEREKAEQ